jgi:hypothetical protein
MFQANWVIILHFVLLWGSVGIGLMADWKLPISYLAAIPLGIFLWASGLLYNIYSIRRMRDKPAGHRTALARSGYRRIAARTMMNLGIGLAFRSWPTFLAAIILIPLYSLAASQRRHYLDYMRSGMLSDAFPDRISKH